MSINHNSRRHQDRVADIIHCPDEGNMLKGTSGVASRKVLCDALFCAASMLRVPEIISIIMYTTLEPVSVGNLTEMRGVRREVSRSELPLEAVTLVLHN